MIGLNIEEENRKRGIISPKGRRMVPAGDFNIEEVMREERAIEFLESLGYASYCWDAPSYNNKYYDEKKYEDISLEIELLIIDGKDVPKEYIDYMLEVKKIKEKYNLDN
jgi:hypothetical protein